MIKRWVGRSLNNALGRVGLRIDYIENDFDDRPVDTFSRRKLFSAMGRQFESWISRQRIFEVADTFDAAAATEEFFDEWLLTPFRQQQGGSRFNNLLWLFLITKSYSPRLIVDSGTYQGASAWALSRGKPNARAYSFDIDLSQLRLRCPTVEYIEGDWTKHLGAATEHDRSLVYFDDHVDQIRRLLEAGERRYRVAIFDDDCTITSFFSMARSASVLPKIEFALDEELADGQVIEWVTGGSRHSWQAVGSYLQRGRSMIAATERLPNTSLISGIHQTPYRIVALRPK